MQPSIDEQCPLNPKKATLIVKPYCSQVYQKVNQSEDDDESVPVTLLTDESEKSGHPYERANWISRFMFL